MPPLLPTAVTTAREKVLARAREVGDEPNANRFSTMSCSSAEKLAASKGSNWLRTGLDCFLRIRDTFKVRVIERFFSGVPHPHLLGVCHPSILETGESSPLTWSTLLRIREQRLTAWCMQMPGFGWPGNLMTSPKSRLVAYD